MQTPETADVGWDGGDKAGVRTVGVARCADELHGTAACRLHGSSKGSCHPLQVAEAGHSSNLGSAMYDDINPKPLHLAPHNLVSWRHHPQT
jgi:hypothetical protein